MIWPRWEEVKHTAQCNILAVKDSLRAHQRMVVLVPMAIRCRKVTLTVKIFSDFLVQKFLDEKQTLNSNLVSLDFPADRCPLVLLPFLFEKEEDIHFEKLLADSSVSTIMTSSNSVGQKLSTNMSLADIIRESGFTSCSRYALRICF